MKKLFGTDGIRGVAGQPPLDAPTVYAIGSALARTLAATSASPRILLGMDTRESSEAIAATLTAGLTVGSASVESAGVITTPAVAFLTHTHRFDAGVVISASHNPWQDNGIKFFGPDGYKLPDAVELASSLGVVDPRVRGIAAEHGLGTREGGDRRGHDSGIAAHPGQSRG